MNKEVVIAYASEVLLVADSLGGGKVLIETGVRHVSVGSLVVLLVV